jgi:N-acetylmuramoyl-L-alanine amidase
MAAYAHLHYGLDRSLIVGPHVIVEHYTTDTSVANDWALFASNRPDGELGGLPGDCAHFIISTTGVIYQLVPLDVMCRHTVGLNWTAIGVEHEGTSDASILSNPAELRASLLLTAWLMHRFSIPIGDVIGHAESLDSPYHRERVASWRCQTHADWQHADMTTYRRLLLRILRADRAPAGPGYAATAVASSC